MGICSAGVSSDSGLNELSMNKLFSFCLCQANLCSNRKWPVSAPILDFRAVRLSLVTAFIAFPATTLTLKGNITSYLPLFHRLRAKSALKFSTRFCDSRLHM